MYCGKCGTPNSDGYKFCRKCGVSLLVGEPSEKSSLQSDRSSDPSSSSQASTLENARPTSDGHDTASDRGWSFLKAIIAGLLTYLLLMILRDQQLATSELAEKGGSIFGEVYRWLRVQSPGVQVLAAVLIALGLSDWLWTKVKSLIRPKTALDRSADEQQQVVEAHASPPSLDALKNKVLEHASREYEMAPCMVARLGETLYEYATHVVITFIEQPKAFFIYSMNAEVTRDCVAIVVCMSAANDLWQVARQAHVLLYELSGRLRSEDPLASGKPSLVDDCMRELCALKFQDVDEMIALQPENANRPDVRDEN